MSDLPLWTADADRRVPDDYMELAVRYGEQIRAGEIGRSAVMAETGISKKKYGALYALVKGNTPHDPPTTCFGREAAALVNREHSQPPGVASVSGFDELRDEKYDIEGMLQQRAATFRRVAEQHESSKVRRIRLHDDLPIGICHMGDPHLDDDSCNWPRLRKALDAVNRTPGMYAGNIGDTTNNWVGSLQRLYAKQEATFEQAITLARWYFEEAPHIYFMMGNHDKWNHGEYVMRDILRNAQVSVVARHEARIEFEWSGGEVLRMVCRHDFPGRSQWNKVHGAAKRAKFEGGWGDLYIQGHRHTWGVSQEEVNGSPSTSIIVRGFKWYDSYAAEKGFSQDTQGECCVTILDPGARRPTEKVRVVWDPDEGADILRWLRERRA